jgi:hypothetical protein
MSSIMPDDLHKDGLVNMRHGPAIVEAGRDPM